ncbi:anthrax toxin lethal factor-related metalloendopeptidase [Bacillus alveayuensis]|jgi:Pro-Pro endopeptidase|uniref:anthrax toxin lethal factor-related metalloendopeptidase n=1 Tax=Aeribacillus alveayuensis TaxID=279215 RepID=UPI0005CDC644|nr:toxin [Bacillus alveayuensis]
MKRILFFLMLILLIAPLLSFSPYSPVSGTLLKEYPSLSLSGIPSDKYEALKQIVILPEGEFAEQEAKKMIETLAKTDKDLLQDIAKKRIYVKFFTGKLTDEPTARYLRGKIPRGYTHSPVTWDDVPGLGGNHIVLVKIGHSERGKGHGSINLELHELAHSIDRLVFNGIRFQPRFLAIWRKEAHHLFSGNPYFLDYPEEYFAESFAMYYYSRETRQQLKENAPLTYQYIKNLEK